MPKTAATPARFAEYHGGLKRRIDAELGARLGDWFPSLPRAHLETLSGIVADGKRLRGTLTCLVAQALGGRVERALPAALAVEIIQAASLVHDDFVDGDALRRGRPAAWTVLSPQRAVLLADVMFATAIEKMAQEGAREGATLARAIATMAQGAFHETLAEGRTEGAAYRRINALKTGSLFAAAARLGALAASAGHIELQAATEYGALAGEAYQIADDLADPVRPGSVDVRPGMEEEIAALIERAQGFLARFPDGEATRLLAQLPGEFARLAS